MRDILLSCRFTCMDLCDISFAFNGFLLFVAIFILKKYDIEIFDAEMKAGCRRHDQVSFHMCDMFCPAFFKARIKIFDIILECRIS